MLSTIIIRFNALTLNFRSHPDFEYEEVRMSEFTNPREFVCDTAEENTVYMLAWMAEQLDTCVELLIDDGIVEHPLVGECEALINDILCFNDEVRELVVEWQQTCFAVA